MGPLDPTSSYFTVKFLFFVYFHGHLYSCKASSCITIKPWNCIITYTTTYLIWHFLGEKTLRLLKTYFDGSFSPSANWSFTPFTKGNIQNGINLSFRFETFFCHSIIFCLNLLVFSFVSAIHFPRSNHSNANWWI